MTPEELQALRIINQPRLEWLWPTNQEEMESQLAAAELRGAQLALEEGARLLDEKREASGFESGTLVGFSYAADWLRVLAADDKRLAALLVGERKEMSE